jgi:hypothetical protein
MKTNTNKAKAAPVFLEIPDESVSARRIRYWKWKHIQAKLEGKKTTRGRPLKDLRRGGVQDLGVTVRMLIKELNDVKNALAKMGITVPQLKQRG